MYNKFLKIMFFLERHVYKKNSERKRMELAKENY